MSTTIAGIRPTLCFLGLALALCCPLAGQERQSNSLSSGPATSTQQDGTLDDRPSQPLASKLFERPVRLMVGEVPLNVEANQMYPSPAMFDIDDDGQIELIVGDIFGSLNVYENENLFGQGDPVWSPHQPLISADGQQIKVSNW